MLDNVPRRHAGDGTVQDSTGETADPDYLPSGDTRICGQLGEIPVTTSPEDPVPGVPDRLPADDGFVNRGENRALISSMQDGTAAELARLIGKLTATLPAIFPAPLWYRELQQPKNQAFQSSHSFEASVLLTQEALLELDWWSSKMSLVNGKKILTQELDMVMETDASMLGWGAVCNGTRTGGLWNVATT